MQNANAPGCFGYPSIYNPKSKNCTDCHFKAKCKASAFEMLTGLQEKMDCSAILWKFDDMVSSMKVAPKEPVKSEIGEYQSKLISAMPKKVQATARAMCKKGIHLAASLDSGINPFKQHKPKFLKIPCEMILDRKEFTRKDLRVAFQQEHSELSENTITSHITQSIQILQGFNVVKECDGGYFRRA